MGSCFSCKRSPPFDGIRVVHLSGYVEDFAEPMTVAQVTGNHKKHFLCSSAHLRSLGSQSMPLQARLEMGHIYFLLPYTIFRSDSSPVDLVSLATRLTAIAMRDSGGGGGGSPYKLAASEGRRCHLGVGSCGSHMDGSVRSWKPILEAIEERSIEYRCASE